MCLQLFELTSYDLIGQAPCPPMFCNAIIDQSPAERLNDLLCKPVGLRLPNEPLNLKATWSMEEAFTIAYTMVDDIYKKLFVKQAYFRRSPNSAPAFSDAEVITLALACGTGRLRVPTRLVEVCQKELSAPLPQSV